MSENNEMVVRLGLDRKYKRKLEQHVQAVKRNLQLIEEMLVQPKLCRLNKKPKEYKKRKKESNMPNVRPQTVTKDVVKGEVNKSKEVV